MGKTPGEKGAEGQSIWCVEGLKETQHGEAERGGVYPQGGRMAIYKLHNDTILFFKEDLSGSNVVRGLGTEKENKAEDKTEKSGRKTLCPSIMWK